MASLGGALGGLGGALSGGLGSAVVYVSANTQKLSADLAKARAITEGETASMGSGIAAMMKKNSAAIATAGVAAVAAYGAYAVKAFTDAEAAAAKLNNTIDNNVAMTDVSKESWDELVNTIGSYSGANDEALLSAASMLGQFDLTGSEIQELLPLVNDLSMKMGIDLTSAAQKVGKATEGNTKALLSFGIHASDFDSTISGLTRTAGGFGKAYGETLPGKMAVLSGKFQEIGESVGESLVPALNSAADTALVLLDALEKLTDWVPPKAMQGFFTGALPSVVSLAEATARLATGIQKVGDGTMQLDPASLDAYAKGIQTGALTFDDLRTAMEGVEGVDVDAEILRVATAAGVAAPSMENLTKAELALVEANELLIQSQEELVGGMMGIEEAADAQGDATRELAAARRAEAKAIREFGKTSPEAIAAHEKTEDAIRGVINTTHNLERAVADLKDKVAEGDLVPEKAIADIRRMGRETNVTKKEMNDYIAVIRQAARLPDVKTKVEVLGVREAIGEIDNLFGKLNAFDGQTFTALAEIKNLFSRLQT